jgi:hypothetical protein
VKHLLHEGCMSVFQDWVSNPMIGNYCLITCCMTDELSAINKLESIYGAPIKASEAPATLLREIHLTLWWSNMAMEKPHCTLRMFQFLECKVYSGFSSHAWLPEGISIQEHFKSGLQLCLWQQRHGSLPVLRRSARCDQGTVPGIPSKHSTQRSKTALSFHLPQKKKHHLPSLAAKLEGL